MERRDYSIAPVSQGEEERLASLRRYQVLDTGFDDVLNRFARVLANALDVPISLISLVDKDRQWFKARVGLEVSETPRDVAFCSHAILGTEIMEIQDAALDPRFAGNPLVVGDPSVRFYAGVPLVNAEGHALGTLCAIDRRPRSLTQQQREILTDLSILVQSRLDLYRYADEATRQALCDPLTGLGNRSHARGFFQALVTAARRHKRPFVVAYLDCDGFKAVNDKLGHAVGDAVLRAVGATLSDSVRGSDLAARMGGDEFLVVLAETNAIGADATLRRIKSRLDDAMRIGGWPITFSIGAKVVETDLGSIEELIAAADEALYDAKRAGKDRIVLRS